MIDIEIENLERKLISLKEKRRELIYSIIKYDLYGFYDGMVSITNIMKAALHYKLNVIIDYSSIKISLFKDKEYDIYHCNLDIHETHSGTPATFIFELKNIKKYMINYGIYKNEFINQLKYRNPKFTDLDKFSEFLDTKTDEELYEILTEHIQNKANLINCEDLKITDIIIVFP